MNNLPMHPELRALFERIPTLPLHNRIVVACANTLMKFMPTPKAGPGVAVENRRLGKTSVRIYRPERALSGAGLLWIHGGGLVIGRPEQDDRTCARLARDLGLVVIAVKYRLAPKHRFPAAIDDCFAAWAQIQDAARDLGIDPKRIAVAGQSAGGGLAACLAQRIHDAGGTQPAAQVLFCPMLDDRTAVRRELDAVEYPLWGNRSNRAGWTWYLGQPAGALEVPAYAAASRREDLTGLPPAWISIGSIELFYEEAVRYAERLQNSDVPCCLHVAQNAPHAFESIAVDTQLSRELFESAYRFLGNTLRLSSQ
jgi:acetyl esterase/lipase